MQYYRMNGRIKKRDPVDIQKIQTQILDDESRIPSKLTVHDEKLLCEPAGLNLVAMTTIELYKLDP